MAGHMRDQLNQRRYNERGNLGGRREGGGKIPIHILK